MQPVRVSVIIPVYNTEQYVEAAIRSIMEQSLREIEILVVNDGSDDRSGTIVERLAAEDSRIRVHTQPNAGQAAARNSAMTQATGEYVYFMDSDDLLDPEALAACYEKCRRDNLDFVFFDGETFGADAAHAPWFDYHRAGAFADRVYTGPELLDAMLRTHTYRASICLHLFRRALLDAHGIQFHAGIVHEDELFTTHLYLAAQRAGRIDRAFFRRRLREGSTMTAQFGARNLHGYLTVLDALRKLGGGHESRPMRRLIRRYIRYTLDPVLRNAWALPTDLRLQTARTVMLHYPCCVTPGALAALLFKRPLKTLLRR